jgi:hypothetical protein
VTLFTIHITETVSILDLAFCKHEELHSSWERKLISSSLLGIKGRFLILLETIVISSSVSRLAHHFITLTATTSISDTVFKVLRKLRAVSDTVSISDSISRFYRMVRNIHETTIVLESLDIVTNIVAKLFQILLDEITNISDSAVRRIRRKSHLVNIYNPVLDHTRRFLKVVRAGR